MCQNLAEKEEYCPIGSMAQSPTLALSMLGGPCKLSLLRRKLFTCSIQTGHHICLAFSLSIVSCVQCYPSQEHTQQCLHLPMNRLHQDKYMEMTMDQEKHVVS